jgi:hypothetical protein
MKNFIVNDLNTKKVTVTAAQIAAMFGAPVTVLPAPGANKVLLIFGIVVQTVPDAALSYTAGGALNFVYHGTSVIPHAGSIAAAVILSATASMNQLPDTAASIQPPVNTGLDITNATQAFATGDGTLILTIWYSIHPLN